MMLFLLKSLPLIEAWNASYITRLFQIVDELIYYAHEAEKRSTCSESPLAFALDEMDKVNKFFTVRSMRNHWTHLRDMPQARGLDEYRKGGNCTFLALAIQARLTKYVKTKLDTEPGTLRSKSGTPLLDYALRPRRVTPMTMRYHSVRDECGIDIEMVQLLLDRGANPNQQVHLNEGRTVWALFLVSCYESTLRNEATKLLKEVWFRVCKLMIRYHASSTAWFDNNTSKPLTVEGILGVLWYGVD
uniref:Ankyrin repeat protein n=1 Tax=Podospora anserina (strain S / ATCC MYA-4624 / DSM 980 / FGSC 10383) TaxID=515849 RepID=A0A090CVF7_PODAN|nr:Putative protein of unknown function [Podospora anserina S mat+]